MESPDREGMAENSMGVASSLRPDTVLREGDKVIAIGKTECEAMLHQQLIGDPTAASAG